MRIRLEPVTIENWYDCTNLKVKPEQQRVFPAPVVSWIAEAKFVSEFQLRAVYGNEELVGFIVFCNKPDGDGNYWIPAVMIDEKYQGRGYGKAALQILIELMSEMGFKRLMIGHRPNNQIAGRLYESLGFEKVSEEVIDGEIVRLLQIT
ncbi:GCN5 family N-acetyltransferase [Brevibacillus reuszeri]|uniref:GCN5 family N-acetyltransferase n=1 Tax=Brevibacillus reuszeri TaxID=54915 RepID=A0A0K9YP59_9BACL|nr:GNAT family N-acetyltransferase [Brevibacillus reuszeri]KNB70432.1 spermidine acetyltransferase [Brevibacillus reuszeri]MED1857967.1 GNAT family N-acetyltransferase [Brevibacillus reuszeri]GED71843.1 GCN5 family N-acetyltransferase [Brevibacillus reuszeri]